jgi:hypothetical protein
VYSGRSADGHSLLIVGEVTWHAQKLVLGLVNLIAIFLRWCAGLLLRGIREEFFFARMQNGEYAKN